MAVVGVCGALFFPRTNNRLDDDDDSSQSLKSFNISAGDPRVVVGRGDITGVTDRTVSRTAG